MTDKVDPPRREYVYTGTFQGKTMRVAVFVAIKDDGTLGRESHFKTTRDTQRMLVGGVYTIPTVEKPDGGMSLVLGAASWVRAHTDASAVAKWQAQQRTQDETQAARKLQQKYNSMHAIDDPIRQLRDAYAALPFSQRIAFECYVLHKLRSMNV